MAKILNVTIIVLVFNIFLVCLQFIVNKLNTRNCFKQR